METLTPGCRYLAPAKINLFLHVVGRNADGYHLLQTVFHFLDYGDELWFEVNDDSDISLSGDTLGIEAAENLIVKAARLLQQTSGSRLGAKIKVKKRIPAGGGFGGGSSDCATTLVALNTLWQVGLSQAELCALGLKLGADVPIFIFGESAFAEGVGERLQAMEIPEVWYCMVTPPCLVSTKDIFSSPSLTRDTTPCKMCDLPLPLRDIKQIIGFGHNDLEAITRRDYREVDFALRWLSRFGPARMTGSGGGVFVPCEDRLAAEQIAKQIPEPYKGFVARGSNRSPLYANSDWGVAKR